MSKKKKPKVAAASTKKVTLSDVVPEKKPPQLDAESTKELKGMIERKLSDVFVVTTATPREILEKQMAREKIDKLTWKEKKEAVKAWRLEHRQRGAKNAILKCDFSVGLQKCLRDARHNRLAWILVDDDTNLHLIKELLGHNSDDRLCPVATVSGLSRLLMKVFGFPAVLLGFKHNPKNVKVFQDFLDLSNKFHTKREKLRENVSVTGGQ